MFERFRAERCVHQADTYTAETSPATATFIVNNSNIASKSNITSYSYIANYIDFTEPNDCKYGGKVGSNLLGKYSGKSNSIFIGRIILIAEVCYILIAAVCSIAKYIAGLGCGISFNFQILLKKVFTILSSIASLDLSVILASNFERSSL